MFPRYGSIFSRHAHSANTPEKTLTATVNALTEFWSMFKAEYSLAKFMFNGSSITGPVVTPVSGIISGFNVTTQLMIPDEAYVKSQLQSGGDAFIGLFRLFSYTISMSTWTLDCKAAGFMTPMIAKLVANFDVQALAFKAKMFGIAPNTHEAAMEVMSDGVEEVLKTCINVANYTGTAGATQLTGLVTVKF